MTETLGNQSLVGTHRRPWGRRKVSAESLEGWRPGAWQPENFVLNLEEGGPSLWLPQAWKKPEEILSGER